MSGQMEGWKDGRKGGQTLFHRTLPATTGQKQNIIMTHLKKNTKGIFWDHFGDFHSSQEFSTEAYI